MHTMHHPSWRGSVIGPLVLVGLGLLVLLGNIGVRTGNVWTVLGQLWPVLLIAAGLELVVGRRVPWAAWLIALGTIAVFGLGVWFLPRRPAALLLASESFATPLGTARRAEVALVVGAGTLKIGALDASSNLIEATMQRRANETIRRKVQVQNDTARVTLRTGERGLEMWPWRSSEQAPAWDVRLHPAVSTTLSVTIGAGQATLDLADLTLTNVAVTTGAGQTMITMPAAGQLTTSVSTGAGQTMITIPSTMAARIRIASGGLGRQVVGNYRQDGDVYVSPHYATATNRLDLEVHSGAGNLVIREAP